MVPVGDLARRWEYQSQRLLYSRAHLEVRKVWQVWQAHDGLSLTKKVKAVMKRKRKRKRAQQSCSRHVRESESSGIAMDGEKKWGLP